MLIVAANVGHSVLIQRVLSGIILAVWMRMVMVAVIVAEIAFRVLRVGQHVVRAIPSTRYIQVVKVVLASVMTIHIRVVV